MAIATALRKVVRPGKLPDGSIYCKIEFDGRKLSISGVVGPLSNGDARGGAGQIVMSFKECDKRGHLSLSDIQPAPGWDADKIKRFFDAWNEWHLNDMRAGCRHQRAEGWGDEELEVVTYGLTSEAHRLRNDALAEAADAARDWRIANLTEAGKFLIGPDWFKDRHSPPDADSPQSGLFEVKKRETKRANWVRPDEHPRGILGKACPECGYQFGSSWLTEEVPAEVIEFLESLPDSDTKPAWV